MIHEVKTVKADLSGLARRIDEAFEEVLATYSETSNEVPYPVQALDAARVRYRLWAGNLGAFLDCNNKASLKYRIRNVPVLEARISELLGDLLQELDDCM